MLKVEKEFNIDKWLEERKQRWAEICAKGDQAEIRDPKAIMEMDEETYKREFGQNN